MDITPGAMWISYLLIIVVLFLLLYVGLRWPVAMSAFIATLVGAAFVVILTPLVQVNTTEEKQTLAFLIGIALILVFFALIALVAAGSFGSCDVVTKTKYHCIGDECTLKSITRKVGGDIIKVVFKDSPVV